MKREIRGFNEVHWLNDLFLFCFSFDFCLFSFSFSFLFQIIVSAVQLEFMESNTTKDLISSYKPVDSIQLKYMDWRLSYRTNLFVHIWAVLVAKSGECRKSYSLHLRLHVPLVLGYMHLVDTFGFANNMRNEYQFQSVWVCVYDVNTVKRCFEIQILEMHRM